MIAAYCFLLDRERDRDNYEALNIGALASRGTEDAVNKQSAEWAGDIG